MIANHACVTVACDICKYVYDQDESHSVHFDDLAEARNALTGLGWTITADGEAICSMDDGEHQAAIAALMPPEPVMQVPGQLGFDGTEAGS
ncbi:hypothetical protein ABZV65_19730 [Streptomyces bauhiniae]|uniref:hypothetical protein n=1 Tax=Streptomyces bauhiniae TaxID=2340725 RepID=UPI0033BD7888